MEPGSRGSAASAGGGRPGALTSESGRGLVISWERLGDLYLVTARAKDRTGRLPPEERLTPDQARELKRLAQTAYGYAEGERRLRADVGFEVDEQLTLRHLAAHVPVERYEQLRATYEARRQAAVAADVP